jgi:quinol monooxygenase YgiN
MDNYLADVMNIDRRSFIVAVSGALASAAWSPVCSAGKGGKQMYGLIGKITAASGQRDALIAILLEGIKGMPGCLSYVIAKDSSDANAIWVTEVWDNKASHDSSLSLPSVRQAIARGKPLIAGFSNNVVTQPIGGHGLGPAQSS